MYGRGRLAPGPAGRAQVWGRYGPPPPPPPPDVIATRMVPRSPRSIGSKKGLVCNVRGEDPQINWHIFHRRLFAHTGRIPAGSAGAEGLTGWADRRTRSTWRPADEQSPCHVPAPVSELDTGPERLAHFRRGPDAALGQRQNPQLVAAGCQSRPLRDTAT